MAAIKETVRSGNFYIAVDIPDLSQRGVTTKVRRVMDESLQWHRRSHLPRHFVQQAYTWYPGPYAVIRSWHQDLTAKALAKALERKKLGLGPTKGRDYGNATRAAEKAERNAAFHEEGAYLAALDRGNMHPLYHTGRAKQIITAIPANPTGTVQDRRIRIKGFPYYIKYIPGAFPALEAVSPAESALVAARFEKLLMKELTK